MVTDEISPFRIVPLANSLTVPVLNIVGGGIDQLVEQKCKQNIACCQNTDSEAVCVFPVSNCRCIPNRWIEWQPRRRRRPLRCSWFAHLNREIRVSRHTGGSSHEYVCGLRNSIQWTYVSTCKLQCPSKALFVPFTANLVYLVILVVIQGPCRETCSSIRAVVSPVTSKILLFEVSLPYFSAPFIQ